jgi:hypothetical protein
VADTQLRWRNGPMVGLQAITARHGIDAGVDEFLDWAVSLYARAYKYSGDPHYLAVTWARCDFIRRGRTPPLRRGGAPSCFHR